MRGSREAGPPRAAKSRRACTFFGPRHGAWLRIVKKGMRPGATPSAAAALPLRRHERRSLMMKTLSFPDSPRLFAGAFAGVLIATLAESSSTGCIIDAGSDSDGSTGTGSTGAPDDGPDDGPDDSPDEGPDEGPDDSTDGAPDDGTDDGALECRLCETDALVDACAGLVATCEADPGPQGCDALAVCLLRCSERDDGCIEACVAVADDIAVAQLDDVFVCVGEACPLCEPIDLDPIDPRACAACEDEAIDGACAKAAAACDEDLDCVDLQLCLLRCEDNDRGCFEVCIETASETAIDLIDAIGVCIDDACPLC